METVQEEEEDRISALPDQLILHILSFLTVEDSAPTSILSKRWRYQWMFNPNLVFPDYSNFYHPVGTCSVAAIDKCIQLYKAEFLQKFRLNLHTNIDVSKKIDQWIHFAANKRVQKLHVSIFMNVIYCIRRRYERHCEYVSVPFKVPDCLFSSQNLQEMKLNGGLNTNNWCQLYPPPPSHLKCTASLKHLSLSNIDSFDGVIHALVSQCRQLETLILVNVYGFHHLEIFLPLLIRLEISCELEHVEIVAPTLQFLRCGRYISRGLNVISESPQLQRVDLINQVEQICFSESTMKNISDLKSLHIVYYVFKSIYADYILSGSKIVFNNLKEFHLKGMEATNSSNIYALTRFLCCCPTLEKIHIMFYNDFKEEQSLVKEENIFSECSSLFFFKQLRFVNFKEFTGDVGEMLLVKFLLEKGSFLERLILKLNPMVSICRERLQEVFTFPKASSAAMITLLNFNNSPLDLF